MTLLRVHSALAVEKERAGGLESDSNFSFTAGRAHEEGRRTVELARSIDAELGRVALRPGSVRGFLLLGCKAGECQVRAP